VQGGSAVGVSVGSRVDAGIAATLLKKEWIGTVGILVLTVLSLTSRNCKDKWSTNVTEKGRSVSISTLRSLFQFVEEVEVDIEVANVVVIAVLVENKDKEEEDDKEKKLWCDTVLEPVMFLSVTLFDLKCLSIALTITATTLY
jgi:hypothetical protein